MAAALSSAAGFATSASALKKTTTTTRNPFGSFSSRSPLHYNPLSLHGHFPRKSPLVRATLLEDNEMKVAVEDSFPSKSFLLDKDGTGNSNGDSPSSSASALESWTIKIEQSINIFLTDSVIKELGGNEWWFDRFLAQHIAIFYYFMTVFMYAISPRMAYHFSECVESHAFSTYNKFIKEQGDELKTLPASEVAVKYYTGDDLYLFDEFQTSRPPESRRPKIENLYDVFVNIRDDEAEHCKTMRACQTHGNLRSPHSLASEDGSECILPEADCEGIVDCIQSESQT